MVEQSKAFTGIVLLLWTAATVVSSVLVANSNENTHARVEMVIPDPVAGGSNDYVKFDDSVKLAWALPVYSAVHMVQFLAMMVPAVRRMTSGQFPFLYKFIYTGSATIVVLVLGTAIGIRELKTLVLLMGIALASHATKHGADNAVGNGRGMFAFASLMTSSAFFYALNWTVMWMTYVDNPRTFAGELHGLWWVAFALDTIEIFLPFARKLLDKDPESSDSEDKFQTINHSIRVFGGLALLILMYFGGFAY